jgi:hypothetical protein
VRSSHLPTPHGKRRAPTEMDRPGKTVPDTGTSNGASGTTDQDPAGLDAFRPVRLVRSSFPVKGG